jgi:AraC-like DNA-binding protein
MQAGGEWARFYKRSHIYDIELIHAAFITHAFPWHVHDYFVIGVIETGSQTFSCRGGKQRTPAGGIFVVHPDEPHTGEPATSSGFTYRTFYPSVAVMRHAATELTGRQQPQPFFPTPVINDPALARRFLALHRTLIRPNSTLEGETQMLETLAAMIARHADSRCAVRPFGQERAAIRRVREYIEAHYDRDISLTFLAQLVSLSPFYFARVFRAEVGLPPHAYLESVRIRQAQHLVSDGAPLSQVAYATGFADQSHFTHRFKRLIGVTPGQYTGQRKIIQDAAPCDGYADGDDSSAMQHDGARIEHGTGVSEVRHEDRGRAP